jgi:hypothetical protein
MDSGNRGSCEGTAAGEQHVDIRIHSSRLLPEGTRSDKIMTDGTAAMRIYMLCHLCTRHKGRSLVLFRCLLLLQSGSR